MDKAVLHWSKKSDRQQVCDVLQRNELVLGTTDTILGLFSNTTLEGFEQLNTIKRRSEKPYLLLISSIERMAFYAQPDEYEALKNLVQKFWPGPLTVIFKARPDISDFLTSSVGTVAVRVPRHEGILDLLALIGRDLFSTSANIAGEWTPNCLDDINPQLMAAVAAVIDGACSGNEAPGVPSTLLDCSFIERPTIIREGALSAKDLGLEA